MVKNERPDRETETPISPEVGSAYAGHGENFALADLVLSRRTGRESRAESPILGHYFKLPDLSGFIDPDQPTLDTSLPYIPVYTHLITHELAPIERPTTPTIIRTLRSGGTIHPSHRYKSRASFEPARINGIVDRTETINDSGRCAKYQDSDGASSVRTDQS